MSAFYCKAHVNHHARHGSYWHHSLKATDLAPYRAAAHEWARQHRMDRPIGLYVRELDNLLTLGADGGWGVALKGLAAKDKARVTLGRLGAAGVTGERLLEVAFAVACLIGVRGIISVEYLEVQIAKVLMRMHAPTRATRWRPSDSRARATGGGLRVLGHHVWFLANLAINDTTLRDIALLAEPRVEAFQRAEARRVARAQVRRNTEAAIARHILRGRERGMGPAELEQMRTVLRQRYGLR